MSASDWVSFWDSRHSVYVNRRHLEAHYRRIADDLLRTVPQGSAMLDYGCGEALSHGRIAERASRLILCDAAPGVRAGLASRFADNGKVAVHSPDEVAALPEASLDLIVMHSVAQYLTADQLDERLVLFRRLLRSDGMLVLGDIIPPNVSPIPDALSLLRFGAQEGFFFAAGFGLVRTLFSNYARLRSTLGLAHYDEAAISARLSTAGFASERAAQNVGHNPARLTFLARPRQ
jgi:SAM-dependent methyltransferase